MADLKRRIAALEIKATLPPADSRERELYVATCDRMIADLRPILELREAQLQAALADESARAAAGAAQFDLCLS
ncbi:MAG: hypothetical protein ABIJ57_13115 [Pseudomonadota bacterium]